MDLVKRADLPGLLFRSPRLLEGHHQTFFVLSKLIIGSSWFWMGRRSKAALPETLPEPWKIASRVQLSATEQVEHRSIVSSSQPIDIETLRTRPRGRGAPKVDTSVSRDLPPRV